MLAMKGSDSPAHSIGTNMQDATEPEVVLTINGKKYKMSEVL